jgi:hypothetical protein
MYFQNILDTEKFLLSQEIAIPVYFTHHSQQLEEMYTSIKESTSKDSASSAAQGSHFSLLLYPVCLNLHI